MAKHYEIYLIESADFWYVGSTTIGAYNRYLEHLRGTGRAPLLKEALHRHGASFSFQVLAEGYGDPILSEQQWYDRFVATDLRQTLNAKRPDSWDGCMQGKTHRPESRAKMSASHRGKPAPNKGQSASAETREKLSQAHKGLSPSSSTRAKISQALKGHPVSEETRAKISATSRRNNGQ